jgi:hypothetical protein
MPVFLSKIKVISKLKNITFLKIIFFTDQIKVIETFVFFSKFLKVLKNSKNI